MMYIKVKLVNHVLSPQLTLPVASFTWHSFHACVWASKLATRYTSIRFSYYESIFIPPPLSLSLCVRLAQQTNEYIYFEFSFFRRLAWSVKMKRGHHRASLSPVLESEHFLLFSLPPLSAPLPLTRRESKRDRVLFNTQADPSKKRRREKTFLHRRRKKKYVHSGSVQPQADGFTLSVWVNLPTVTWLIN